ncbi:MAG: hypothetical protein WBD97_01565, partial [Pseudolabrys sp.]
IVHWVGGAHSELRLPKRRRGQRNSTSADIIQAVRQLVLIASDDLCQCRFKSPQMCRSKIPQLQG